jgi:uncharacterized protein (TIGR02453 family)
MASGPIVAPFTGFPPEGIQFLNDLAANNDKPWFEANKAIYLKCLQEPAVALVAALGRRLHERFPEVRYDTRTNGSGTLMRIYRDTRFSADKSPYKTNVAMMFNAGGDGKMSSPGFGLQLTPEHVELIAGVFAFTPEDLAAYRDAVLDEALGAELERAAAAVRAAGAYPIAGVGYKRVPKGLPADHPRAPWLLYKGLHVFAPPISHEVAQTAALVDLAFEAFMAMAPIEQWLTRALAEPTS